MGDLETAISDWKEYIVAEHKVAMKAARKKSSTLSIRRRSQPPAAESAPAARNESIDSPNTKFRKAQPTSLFRCPTSRFAHVKHHDHRNSVGHSTTTAVETMVKKTYKSFRRCSFQKPAAATSVPSA